MPRAMTSRELQNKYRGPKHVDRTVRFDPRLERAVIKLAEMDHVSFNQVVRSACWETLRRRNLLTLAS